MSDRAALIDYSFLPPDHGLAWPDYLRPSREPAPRALQRPNLAGRKPSLVMDRERSMVGRSPCVNDTHGGYTVSGTSRDRNLSYPVDALSSADLARVVSHHLRREFADRKSGIKAVQQAANCNAPTARNWWHGHNAPDAVNLLRLAARVPALKAEVARLIAMESQHDPEFQRALADLIRAAQRTRP